MPNVIYSIEQAGNNFICNALPNEAYHIYQHKSNRHNTIFSWCLLLSRVYIASVGNIIDSIN